MIIFRSDNSIYYIDSFDLHVTTERRPYITLLILVLSMGQLVSVGIRAGTPDDFRKG